MAVNAFQRDKKNVVDRMSRLVKVFRNRSRVSKLMMI